jgi:transposase
MKEQLHQRYFDAKQLALPLSVDSFIPFDSEVRTFDELFRSLDVRKYLVSGKEKGKLRYNPVNMLKLTLFCHMEKIHSLRNMAKAAQNDIRIMWLIDEIKASHQTIPG